MSFTHDRVSHSGSQEREELEEIKKVAAEALKKLSSAGTSESAKPSGTKK